MLCWQPPKLLEGSHAVVVGLPDGDATQLGPLIHEHTSSVT